MDSLTQAALGAAVGEAVLGKKIGWKASVLGALVATVPDLDVLLVPFYDGLEKISIHRGYSHSILFCLVGAFLFAFILRKTKWTQGQPLGRLWLFAFLTLFTHVLLDTFTTYGTQLFLPLTDWRVGFDSITVVDPVYTLPLMVGLFFALRKDKSAAARRWWNWGGLAVSSAYLLFTLFHKKQVENHFAQQLKKENIEWGHLLTVPVSAANLEWYGVAKNEEYLYMKKYSPFVDPVLGFEKIPVNEHLLDSLDANLVDRMKWFAKGSYAVVEKGGEIRFYNLQVDMQGTRPADGYLAPTAFFYAITPSENGGFELVSKSHPKNGKQ